MATYIQRDINSDLTPYSEFNKELTTSSGVNTSITVALTGLEVVSGGFITPAGVPNSDSWEDSGTWTVEYEVVVGNHQITGRVRCVRLDSAGTILQTGAYTSALDLNSDQTFSPVAPAWTDGEEDADNRLAIEIEFINGSTMDQSCQFGVGTTLNEVVTDITEDNISATTISGTMDLFIQGHNVSSGNIDLFIMGLPSGNIDFFVGGQDTSSGNVDLFVAGKPSGNINLFIGSPDTSSGNIDLFVQSHQLSSGSIDLFIEGEAGSSGNLDLFIRGSDNTSGSMDLFINGHSVISGNIDLFIAGKPSGDIPLFISSLNISSDNLDLFIVGKPSGNIGLFELGHDSSSGNADLFVGGKQTASGTLDLVVDGHQASSGNTDLFVGGRDNSSGTINLFVSGVPEQSSGIINLFIEGSGSTPVSGQIDLFIGSEGTSSGNLDLFINGLEPIPPLVCPPLDTGASIQITSGLVQIYQDRIDALINQLGKSVLLEFDAVKQPCPNCVFDPIRNRSTGIYISGGPRSFERGRQCPWCKGRGFEETVSTKCIEALLKWNPKDSRKYGISLSNHKSVVRIKTFITEADDLIRAKTAIADYQEIETTIARVRLIKNPIPVGLQESRYCISFWELI